MKLHHRMKKAEEHHRIVRRRSPVSSYLKELIYGGVDGSITTFAVVSGFSGATFSNEATMQLSFMVVLLFGLANLFADGVSMGLGNFLAVRSEQGLYKSIRSNEQRESIDHADIEVEETKTILVERGFSEKDADTLTAIYIKNDSYWVDFLMNNELKIPNPNEENPVYTGLATFMSFIFFGFIPLIPFIFMRSIDSQMVFVFSGIGTCIAFILLGILKWRIVGTGNLITTVGEVVFVGGVAASIAFFVGTLFTF